MSETTTRSRQEDVSIEKKPKFETNDDVERTFGHRTLPPDDNPPCMLSHRLWWFHQLSRNGQNTAMRIAWEFYEEQSPLFFRHQWQGVEDKMRRDRPHYFARIHGETSHAEHQTKLLNDSLAPPNIFEGCHTESERVAALVGNIPAYILEHQVETLSSDKPYHVRRSGLHTLPRVAGSRWAQRNEEVKFILDSSDEEDNQGPEEVVNIPTAAAPPKRVFNLPPATLRQGRSRRRKRPQS